MDRPTAFAHLKQLCAADTDPVLTTEDLTLLLDATVRWTIWTATTTYQQSDTVVPTVRNGYRYRALIGRQSTDPSVIGVSGTDEPRWPRSADRRWDWGAYRPMGSVYTIPRVPDGTIVWEEAGVDGTDPYDVRAAVYAAWLLKAARASERITATFGPDKTWNNLVFDHCMTMAQQYRPIGLF